MPRKTWIYLGVVECLMAFATRGRLGVAPEIYSAMPTRTSIVLDLVCMESLVISQRSGYSRIKIFYAEFFVLGFTGKPLF